MRLPKKVRVVDVYYEIRGRRGGVVGEGGKPLFGAMNADAMAIDIDSSAAAERQRWALEHELAHAAFEQTGMCHELAALCGTEKADAIEEDIIRRVLPAWLAALVDAKTVKR